MAIDRIGNNPVSFRGFYNDAKGAYNLSLELVGKPELERKFIQNIVEPLSHTKLYHVFVHGDSASIINNEGKGIMNVILPGSKADHTLGVVYDCDCACRMGLRRNSAVEPTENFRKDGYLLHIIETAKNIVMDKEAIAKSNALESYSKIATETVEEKAGRFEKIFKYNV